MTKKWKKCDFLGGFCQQLDAKCGVFTFFSHIFGFMTIFVCDKGTKPLVRIFMTDKELWKKCIFSDTLHKKNVYYGCV